MKVYQIKHAGIEVTFSEKEFNGMIIFLHAFAGSRNGSIEGLQVREAIEALEKLAPTQIPHSGQGRH